VKTSAKRLRFVALTTVWGLLATGTGLLYGQPYALATRGAVSIKGNLVRIDSFDSSDPQASTDGQYDPAKARANANIVSDINVSGGISVGNAAVAGHLSIGYNGSVSVGPAGSVGDIAWIASHFGIEPGWANGFEGIVFPDFSPPYTSGLAPDGGFIVTSGMATATYGTNSSTVPDPLPAGLITNTSSVFLNSVPDPIPPGLRTNTATVTTTTLPSPVPEHVTTNTTFATTAGYPQPGTYLGTVTTNWNGAHHIVGYTYQRIAGYTYQTTTYSYSVTTYSWSVSVVYTNYVTNFYDHILYSGDYYATSLTGKTIVMGQARLVLPNGLNINDTFILAPTGSLKMFVGISIGITASYLTNQTGLAKNFLIFGDTTCFSGGIGGNGTFVGVIAAPHANININAGGISSLTLVGAFLANSFTMNGSHTQFHYDEDLGRIPVLPPLINSNPQDQSVLPGQNATFSVSASGGEPFQYQWIKNNPFMDDNPLPIIGATNSTLTISNADWDATAYYYVVITDSAGQSSTSESARLTVNYPPFIMQQPADQTALTGSNVTFEVIAGGSWPDTHLMHFQWKLNGADVSGSDNVLTIPQAQQANAGEYTVEIANPGGSITSNPARLMVYETAAASLDSASADVIGGNFQFNITGVPGFRYVISATTNLTDWQPIATNLSPFTFVETNACAFPQRFYRAEYYP
jgi:hypothetical protein